MTPQTALGNRRVTSSEAHSQANKRRRQIVAPDKPAGNKRSSQRKQSPLVVSSRNAEVYLQEAVELLTSLSQIRDDDERKLEVIICCRNRAEAALKSSPPNEMQSMIRKVFKLAIAETTGGRARLGLLDAILSIKPTKDTEMECLHESVRVLTMVAVNGEVTVERRIHASRVAVNQLSYLYQNACSDEHSRYYNGQLAEICELIPSAKSPLFV